MGKNALQLKKVKTSFDLFRFQKNTLVFRKIHRKNALQMKKVKASFDLFASKKSIRKKQALHAKNVKASFDFFGKISEPNTPNEKGQSQL